MSTVCVCQRRERGFLRADLLLRLGLIESSLSAAASFIMAAGVCSALLSALDSTTRIHFATTNSGEGREEDEEEGRLMTDSLSGRD